MKIIHTSDWHIGRTLYRRKRYEEFDAFLSWLVKTIQNEEIDVLLVSGDVFDTTTPTNRSQQLYYNFLCKVIRTSCRHVVIIGGNHDSPSFLNAPKDILNALNVHVVGAATENYQDEVLVLKNHKQEPELIVCAVPYLRDKDIRTVEPFETIEAKEFKLISEIIKHYSNVCEIAKYKRRELEKDKLLVLDKVNNLAASYENERYINRIPIIAMGHLFILKGTVNEGDGVRELYVGSLAHVPWETFPDYIDYAALGHLHTSQKVGQSEHIRYSGSPIPMGYGEAYQDKKVIKVEFDLLGFNDTTKNHRMQPKISEIAIPCFQKLERIAGDLELIESKINELKLNDSNCWLEIEYTGENIIVDLNKTIEDLLDKSNMEILLIKNRTTFNKAIKTMQPNETLDSIDIEDVFLRCLDNFKISLQERSSLIDLYKEILVSIHYSDINAE